MNIKPQSEHLQKRRFLDPEKTAKVQKQNEARWEKQGKTVIKLHESFADGKLPSTEYIREAIEEFWNQEKSIPTELVMTSATKTKKVILCVPKVFPDYRAVTLQIVQGEFEMVR